jgi:hypothetical protein
MYQPADAVSLIPGFWFLARWVYVLVALEPNHDKDAASLSILVPYLRLR